MMVDYDICINLGDTVDMSTFKGIAQTRPFSGLWSVQIQYFTLWNITNTHNWFDRPTSGALTKNRAQVVKGVNHYFGNGIDWTLEDGTWVY